jgi:serine/threonine protein kinase
MNAELIRVARLLEQAVAPQDVFGMIIDEPDQMAEALKKAYRRMAQVTHPDIYLAVEEKILAQRAFTSLGEWYAQAEACIRAGRYFKGGTYEKFSIRIRGVKHEYAVSSTYHEDGLYNRYPCQFEENGRLTQAALKIVRDPNDSSLGRNEARVLRILNTGNASKQFGAYVPTLLDSFILEDSGVTRQASILEDLTGWFSLEEARADYLNGINPKDMGWIFRRLLVALGFAHANGVLHGAVFPRNIYILPKQHGVRLENWSFAACDPQTTGERIAGIEVPYITWYPPEILANEMPGPSADIFLAARSMAYILGGDPYQNTFPASVPRPIQAFLKSCTLPGQKSRPQDAWQVKEEFDDLLWRLWGERKFHPFQMKSEPRIL